MYFLYNAPNNAVGIYIVADNDEANVLAAELGITSADYALFNNLDSLPTDWQLFPQGVTLTLGSTPSYGYSLDGAKAEASTQVKLQNAEAVGMAASNFSAPLLAAQSTIPEGERLEDVVAVFTGINALANTLQTQLNAIQAATSISDLNDIVNPPAISGTIIIDRDNLALDNSFFTTLNNATAADMSLYFPGTDSTVLPDPENGIFNSLGADVFAAGNFECVLQYLGSAIAAFDITTTVPTAYNF